MVWMIYLSLYLFQHQLSGKTQKPTPSRHRFEKPIHNVKKLAGSLSFRNTAQSSGSRIFIPGYVRAANPLRRQSQQSCALWRASQRWPRFCVIAK
ncbi:hypothetical protein [Stakelama pacifica]|uniref:hypothetical protein n=1 Tax=Stakelama pacifica TaxID=517720 RepID=UPI001060C18E|nr:hypothetical protein [Stakelama pacifica]